MTKNMKKMIAVTTVAITTVAIKTVAMVTSWRRFQLSPTRVTASWMLPRLTNFSIGISIFIFPPFAPEAFQYIQIIVYFVFFCFR